MWVTKIYDGLCMNTFFFPFNGHGHGVMKSQPVTTKVLTRIYIFVFTAYPVVFYSANVTPQAVFNL